MKSNYIFYIINIFLTNKVFSSIFYLNRSKNITVTNGTKFIIFNSQDFQNNDEIYFKIKATSFSEDYVYYDFTNNISEFDESFGNKIDKKLNDPKYHKYSTKTEIDYDFDISAAVTKYFTIKKKIKEEEASKKGKYLILLFHCKGNVFIENTENNEVIISKWNLSSEILLCIFSIIFIVYIIYKYKKMPKSQNIKQEYNNESSIKNEISNKKEKNINISTTKEDINILYKESIEENENNKEDEKNNEENQITNEENHNKDLLILNKNNINDKENNGSNNIEFNQININYFKDKETTNSQN